MTDSKFIIDVTRENFAKVMEASRTIPVLMDFWADWCQPCKVLMPVLAKLAEEYQGRFLLAKLNTEESQDIAAHFGIRSIPTVKLFRDGQVVDEFMGALPASDVRAFLDRHIARESDAEIDKAHALLSSGDADGAIALLLASREADPGNSRVTMALARAQAASGDTAAAEATLDALPDAEKQKPEVVALRSHLYFEAQVAGVPAAGELEAALAANPDDHEALFRLGLRRVVEGDYDSAMALLLELMRRNRGFGEDAARRALLKVFELLGNDPRVGQYRRLMASLLH